MKLCFPGELVPAFLEQAAQPVDVVVADDARDRITACRQFVLDTLAAGAPIYGATTGFGPLRPCWGQATSLVRIFRDDPAGDVIRALIAE